TYINKTYTGREFDITLESLSNTFDPTPGIQRAFWSKNFKIGLPFSNASHYANPVVDQLLEDAAVEPDAEKRRALWFKFQNLIYDDVAAIHLVAPDGVTLFKQKMINVRMKRGADWKGSAAIRAASDAAEAAIAGSARVLIRESGTEPVQRVMVEEKQPADTASHGETIA
ncbi:hypothetical protein B7L30_035005, partial [Burkholderia cenocepacia]|nr:hypothetical protein [Burkholderia cenocepacia]